MKLRVRNDSVRLRLSRSEVAALLERGSIETTTQFAPGSALVYRVVAAGEQVTASFEQGEVSVSIPRFAVERWAATDEIAIAGDHAWDGGSLRILVEKDLACSKPRAGEDESDAFPSTVASAHCK